MRRSTHVTRSTIFVRAFVELNTTMYLGDSVNSTGKIMSIDRVQPTVPSVHPYSTALSEVSSNAQGSWADCLRFVVAGAPDCRLRQRSTAVAGRYRHHRGGRADVDSE